MPTTTTFDARVPAQRAALHAILQPTAAELVSRRFRNAVVLTDDFAAKHLTADQRMGLMMDRRSVPAGVSGSVAVQLANLLADEDAARIAFNGGEASAFAIAAE